MVLRFEVKNILKVANLLEIDMQGRRMDEEQVQISNEKEDNLARSTRSRGELRHQQRMKQ